MDFWFNGSDAYMFSPDGTSTPLRKQYLLIQGTSLHENAN